MNKAANLLFAETAPVVDTDGRAIVLDLGAGASLCGVAIAGLGVEALSALIDRAMAEAGTRFAYGRYAEPRELYTSEHFAGAGGERRTVHLGIDLFCAAGTTVRAPLDGRVVALANHARELDYGPMLILEHAMNETDRLYTLYGHLGPGVLDSLSMGQPVNAGEIVADVGAPPGNGNWPPHLHFQLIRDLLDLGSEFPGVAAKSEADYWLNLSPSPARFFPDCDADRLEYAACS